MGGGLIGCPSLTLAQIELEILNTVLESSYKIKWGWNAIVTPANAIFLYSIPKSIRKYFELP